MVVCRLLSTRMVTPRKVMLNAVYASICLSLYFIFRSINTSNTSFYHESKKYTPLRHPPVVQASAAPPKFVNKTVSRNETDPHLCPIRSPYLVGEIRENLENVTLSKLEVSLNTTKTQGVHYVMDVGGHFYPKNCTARQKLAVLIPFRNRHQHLPILLNNLVPVLTRQLLDFRIYVIEQEPGVTFNKGLLYNTGFISALSLAKFDCVVFHDVDCLPLNDNIIYQCENHPRHLLAAGSKWNFSLSYPQLNGGALLMSREQFININGYSNLYFGWGSEDDDIRSRILKKKYKILRYPKEIGRYFQLKHERDEGNTENAIRCNSDLDGADKKSYLEFLHYPSRRLTLLNFRIQSFRLVKSQKRQMSEGLHSTVCKIRSIEVKPLFVWIRVSVNMTQVLQTTPKDLTKSITEMIEDAKKFDKLGLGHSEVGDTLRLPS